MCSLSDIVERTAKGNGRYQARSALAGVLIRSGQMSFASTGR